MSTSRNARNVSVIGLGMMGSALAAALLNAGHKVTVWNRTPAKAKPLIGKGAHGALSASDAISASELTVICVTGHEATMKVLDNVQVPPDGRTLVQLSTMTSEESRDLDRWAKANGLRYLDGSIFGLPTTVVDGGATLVYSGPKDLFEENEELLSALGAAKHLSAETGASVTFDRVWYSYGYSVAMAFLHGAAMTHAMGFSLDVYFDMVRARAPSIVNQLLQRGEKIASRRYETTDATMKIWADSFEGTLAMCRDKGVDDKLPTVVMELFRRACASGYADSDLAALFEVMSPKRQSPTH